ncbi:4Fe-4S binding protein [Robinsoniella peoriensis]|uniref:4Fe-4S binding protein n=1 Tax=Robinsoniella peoriensis TaxID=180332 RepID=UPI00085C5FB9|nr:4Fe-4S binding protein [Robinsoniella peoriensis]
MGILTKLRNHIRLVVQIAFTAVSNGYVNGFLGGTIFKGSTKNLCVPGLNCYSCPGALGSCPIGSLQAVLGSRKYQFSFYVIGFLMAFGAFFGRFICGWLCPFGLVQDLLHKIPFPVKIRKVPGDKFLKYLKYIILVVFVIILPMFAVNLLGNGDPWFCKWICPSGTLFGGIPLVSANPPLQEAIGFLFNWKMGILILIIVLSIVIYRPFCRYLCPLGAIYGCFNKVSIYRYKVDDKKCINCKKCQKVCEMNIPVYEMPNSPECIRCGKCKKSCPTGAISSTMSKLYGTFYKK